MLFRILKDAFRFFDRKWPAILMAAVLSVGLADIISLAIRVSYSLPDIPIVTTDGKPIGLSYNDLIEASLFFMANIWFAGFVAIAVWSDIQNSAVRFIEAMVQALKLYPRIFIAYITAQIIISFGMLMVISTLPLGFISIVFLIPALIFTVWFSVVVPVVVIDRAKRVREILLRSRILVHGYFWTVLIAIAVAFIPIISTIGIQTDSVYFWPVTIFIKSSSAIIEAIVISMIYINLRLAKGLKLSRVSKEATDGQPDI